MFDESKTTGSDNSTENTSSIQENEHNTQEDTNHSNIEQSSSDINTQENALSQNKDSLTPDDILDTEETEQESIQAENITEQEPIQLDESDNAAPSYENQDLSAANSNQYDVEVIDETDYNDTIEPAKVYKNDGDSVLTPGAEEFAGGVAYTRNVDGKTSNGYEWNNHTYSKPIQKQKDKSSSTGFRVFIGSLLAIFTMSILIVSIFVVRYLTENNSASTASSGYSSKNVTTSDEYDYNSITLNDDNFVIYDFAEHDGMVLSIPQVAAKCSPSSVGIVSEVEVTYDYPFYFSPSTRVAQASGSGFIYGAEGYIITNHHVIEGAQKITVILYNGNEYEAELIGSDSLSDLAVLKIEPGQDDVLIPMEIGDSDSLVVGEPVVAIGCPAGIEFIGTVTDGIISAINRNVEITDDYGSVKKVMTLIQTNATINHGNSGGPLINAKGQVIGINTLKLAEDYEGIGFSIPINGAVSIITQLIDHGTVVNRNDGDYVSSKGMIGINGSEITQSEAEYYNIPRGVLVIQITKDGSASKAGLRRGDIITHYNGVEVHSIDEINIQKGSALAGEEVTLTVFREGYGDDSTFEITFNLDPQE